jgi:hypothetical protein
MEPTVGRTVHFYPKQECITPESMEKYAAIITQVNKDQTVELVTFGPNSVYFQHGVSFAETPEHGKWSWPPRV